MTASGFLDILGPYTTPEQGPGRGPFLSVSLEGIRCLARKLGLTLAGAMILCLEHDIWPARFVRNRGVYRADAQAALLRTHVAVVGCGGLGGVVISLLARIGVGELTVCDGDAFSESNLNRQLLCREDRLGMNKALAAAEELRLLASHTRVDAVPEPLDAGNIDTILGRAQVVIDCLDNMHARNMVARWCLDAAVPFVHGSLAGHEGFAMLARPGDGRLAAFLGRESGPGAEAELGVPTLTPAAIGLLQCQLAVRAVLGGDGLESLWHLDMSVPEIEELQL